MAAGLRFVLVLIAGCVTLTDAQLMCFECSSTQLRDRWQMVGYPYKFPDTSSYTSNCANNQNKDSTTRDDGQTIPADPRKQCPSFCVTYAFSAQDAEGKVIPNSYWTVRGCYDTLMSGADRKAVTELTTDGDTAKRIENGQMLLFNNKSEEVQMQVAVQACRTDSCNSAAVSTFMTCDPTDKTCSTPLTTQNCRVASSAKSGEQQGVHCTKYVTQVNGWQSVTRAWSNVSPLVPPGSKYPDDKDRKGWICTYYQDGLYTAPSGYSQVLSTTCHCNDQKYCNGGNRIVNIIFLAFFPALVYPIRKFW